MANTREDGLSEFGELEDARSEASACSEERGPHVAVAVTSSGVRWSFISDDTSWSPPTAALLKARDPAHGGEKNW